MSLTLLEGELEKALEARRTDKLLPAPLTFPPGVSPGSLEGLPLSLERRLETSDISPFRTASRAW